MGVFFSSTYLGEEEKYKTNAAADQETGTNESDYQEPSTVTEEIWLLNYHY